MNTASSITFAHEKLIAYQRSISFVAWSQSLLESVPAKLSVRDQLDRASTSIPLNIAEGNVKLSSRDKARYLQIAHGSTVECAACLDVLVAKGIKSEVDIRDGKALLHEICRLLLGLLKTFHEDRIHESAEVYGQIATTTVSESESESESAIPSRSLSTQ